MKLHRPNKPIIFQTWFWIMIAVLTIFEFSIMYVGDWYFEHPTCSSVYDHSGCADEYLYWDEKPENLTVLTWEDLPIEDRIFCEQVSNDVDQKIVVTNYFNDSSEYRVIDINKDWCPFLLTVESLNGRTAHELLAVMETETGGNCAPYEECFSRDHGGFTVVGAFQILDSAFEHHKPWPDADIKDPLVQTITASNILTAVDARLSTYDNMFTRERYLTQFSCTNYRGERVNGCAVWSFHRPQAEQVYETATTLRALR